jgi:thiol-disulfide isomerase/thioredoxin
MNEFQDTELVRCLERLGEIKASPQAAQRAIHRVPRALAPSPEAHLPSGQVKRILRQVDAAAVLLLAVGGMFAWIAEPKFDRQSSERGDLDGVSHVWEMQREQEPPETKGKKELEALEAEYEKQIQAFENTYQLTKSEAEKDKLLQKYPAPEALYPRFMALAQKYPKDPVAAEALVWVVAHRSSREWTDEEESTHRRALSLLQSKYIDSDRVVNVLEFVPFDPVEMRGEKFLRAVLSKSPHRQVKAVACYELAKRRLRQVQEVTRWRNEYPERFKNTKDILRSSAFGYLWTTDVPKVEQEAEELLERLAKEYGDVPVSPEPSANSFANLAKRQLYASRNLAVGKNAPELAEIDLAGKATRLSDLRGKVVVLDVWATWCGPCRAMIPHQRALVKRCEDKPFALVSISVDEKKDTLAAFLKKEPMPWAHWHNGKEGGVIDVLAVESFPTIYVLDAKGVIRYKNIRGKALDRAVDTLLKEFGQLR